MFFGISDSKKSHWKPLKKYCCLYIEPPYWHIDEKYIVRKSRVVVPLRGILQGRPSLLFVPPAILPATAFLLTQLRQEEHHVHY